MNRSLERYAILTGIIIFLCSVQFGACLAGGAIALPIALLISAVAVWLWMYFDLPSGRMWLPPLICMCAVMLCVILSEFAFRKDFAEWFSFVPAGIGSGVTLYLLLLSKVRCSLCNRRLSTQSLTFQCPRCHMRICDEFCWNFEHRRCTLCLEQRVPILSTHEHWWTRVAGPRYFRGRCQICLGSAEKLDLRICPNCRRPQCRDCWDFNNGNCQRCGTSLPDLPSSLTMMVAHNVHRASIHNV